MSEPKTNVPKFASFRPKPVQQEAEPRPKDRHEERYSSRSRPEKEHRYHKRHRSRSRERNHAPSRALELDVSGATPDDGSPDIFIVDRKGDEKNLVYGSIHRYSVPPFHRYGAGYVLGASTDLKIDRDLDDGKGVVLRNWKDSEFGRREKYIFARVEKERPRHLRLRPEVMASEPEDTHADFVPLQGPRGTKRKREEILGDGSSDSDQDSRDYRSIYGKIKGKNQPQDPDLQYATDSDSSGSEAGRAIKLDASMREKNVRLSRKVEEFPNDIDAWLELIDHQDALLRARDDRRRVTNAEMRSTADIKIHMYEKALEKTKSLRERERLLQGLMAEGAKIWELNVQADRWEQIAKQNIDSLLLWTSYLNFKQSTFSTFRYEETKELYLSRIKLLLATIENASPDTADSLYQQILYILLRFTVFVRESGYSELAVAIWQVLLELNFCGSKQQLSKDESTKHFQRFWESEVPRLGENGALGWQRYVDNEDSSDIPEPTVDEAHDFPRLSKIFKSWAGTERQRSRCSRAPARTMDEVVEDDPFRVILFSDIEVFLISIPLKLRNLCINTFLLFCRLPLMASDDQESRKWSMDQFIRNDLLDWESARLTKEVSTKVQDDGEAISLESSLGVLLPNLRASSELIPTASQSPQLKEWKDQYGGDNGPVPCQFIRNALKQLTQAHFTEGLAEYHLGFEFANEPELIKKVAKRLLKQHPESLRLYNAYALIEWSRGNKDVAKGVFAAALGMNKTRTETDTNPDSILLWKSLAWCCLEDGNKTSALTYILCIPDGAPDSALISSPTALLRVRQHLVLTRDFLLSSGDPGRALLYAECVALIEYLTGTSNKEPTSSSQGDITTALDTLISFSATLQLRNYSQANESLFQCATRLLFQHCINGPYRPSLIRTHLTNFLSLFPQNTLFLSLYTANEARLRVENRVRSLFLSTTLTPENDCLTSRLFAIQYEMQFGTVHSVKSAFEKAVSSPVSKSSPGLWRFYLLWTVENGKQINGKRKGTAKDIWYRALRACPWAKELYILGFEMLGERVEMEFIEMRGTWRVMGEKELRVHVDLEEEFEEIGKVEEEGKRKAIGHK